MFKELVKIIFIVMFCSNVSYAEDNGSEGKFVIKGKIQGIVPSSKASTSNGSTKFYPLYTSDKLYDTSTKASVGNVLGVAASAAYFLSDHIAIESSVGYTIHKIKFNGTGPQYNVDSNDNVKYNANGTFEQSTKAGIIPFALAVQYHLAPYGKLSPYIGAGYHYSFATASSGSSVSSSKGVLFQAGIDGWVNNDILFNIDIKKLTMSPTVTFKNRFNTDSSGLPDSTIVPTSIKIKLDPLIISAGIGIRL